MKVSRYVDKYDAWVFYEYEHKKPNKSIPYAYGWTIKLRINLRESDYLKHRDAIVNYLTTLDDGEYKTRNLHVVDSFKIATDRAKTKWRKIGFLKNNQQFTCYLETGVKHEDVFKFFNGLQDYISSICEYSATPCATDVAISGMNNISARLERWDGDYLDSDVLKSNQDILDVFMQLQSDDSWIQWLTRAEIRPKRYDATHMLMIVGFMFTYEGKIEYGQQIFKMAKTLRQCQTAKNKGDTVNLVQLIKAFGKNVLAYLTYAQAKHLDTSTILERCSRAANEVFGEPSGHEIITLCIYKNEILRKQPNKCRLAACVAPLFRSRRSTRNDLALNLSAFDEVIDRISGARSSTRLSNT